MDRSKCFDRFHFDNDFSIHDYIRTETEVDLFALENYRDPELTNGCTSTATQFVYECPLVHRFEQSWAKGRVDLKRGVNDYAREFIFSHGRNTFSRKEAETQRKEFLIIL